MPQLLLGLVLGFTTSSSCPGNAVVARYGWNRGFRIAVLAGAGVVSGYGVLFFVALLGLVPLVRTIPIAAVLLWFVGALVFGRLAWSALEDARGNCDIRNAEDAGAGSRAHGRVWLDGLGAGAGNPINIAWWAGLMGPALADSATIRYQFPVGILLGSMTWFVGIAGVLTYLRRRFTVRVYRFILFAGAAVLSAFAVGFLVTGITRIV